MPMNKGPKNRLAKGAIRRSVQLAVIVSALATTGLVVLAQSEPADPLVEGLRFLGEPVFAAEVAAGEQLYAENCAILNCMSMFLVSVFLSRVISKAAVCIAMDNQTSCCTD